MPGEAWARPRLLRVADAGEAPNGQDICSSSSRSRGWRTRSIPTRTARSSGSTASSQGSGLGGQWGARRRRQAGVFRRQRHADADARRHARREARHGRAKSGRTPPPTKLCGTAPRLQRRAGRRASPRFPASCFSGSADGGLRAYSTDDGSIVWQFDTNREFETVNGVKANGGAMDGPGAGRRRRHGVHQLRLRRLRRPPGQRAARVRRRLARCLHHEATKNTKTLIFKIFTSFVVFVTS